VVLSGNQALDPAGFAPALITSTREKDTGLSRKISTFAILPGQIDQIPFSIRA
jgi:hypothetical protein